MQITINLEHKVDDELQELIYSQFKEYSLDKIGTDGNIQTYAYTARADDQFLGIVSGKVFYGSLHIKNLLVSKEARGKGIGSMLIKKAFEHGIANKCKFAVVETMSFQALDFYKSHGFVEEFTREGYEGDSSFHYLRKEL